jgi:hypothetical protein
MKQGYHEECDAILATMLLMHQNDELAKERGTSAYALLCDPHIGWMMKNRGNQEMVLSLCLTIIESAGLITSTGSFSHSTFYKLTKNGIAFQLNDSFKQKKELDELQKDLLTSQINTNKRMLLTLVISLIVSIISVVTAIITISDNRSDKTLKDKISNQDMLLTLKKTQLQKMGLSVDSLQLLLFRSLSDSSHK